MEEKKGWKVGALTIVLILLFLLVIIIKDVRADGAPDTGNGIIVFTEKAIGGTPYKVNVRLTKTISQEDEPYIVLTNENNYSGSLSAQAGQYTVQATIVDRSADDDIVASVVNATVYVTAGLEQPITVYVGTIEDLKAAGAYLEDGDTGYGKTVTELSPDSQKEDMTESGDIAQTKTDSPELTVDYEEIPETEKGLLEILWGFRYLIVSVLVIALAVFGVPMIVRRDRNEDDDDRAIWKD